MHALLLLSLIAADAEPAVAPKGAPPLLVFVQAGGKIVQTVTKAVPVTEERLVTKEVDGKKVVEKVTVTVYKTVTQQVLMMLGKANFSTADGKKLGADEAKKALSSDQVVVMSVDGKPVDPAYLKAFKGGTLVVVPEAVAAPAFPGVRPGVRPLPAPLPPVEVRPQPAPAPAAPARD